MSDKFVRLSSAVIIKSLEALEPGQSFVYAVDATGWLDIPGHLHLRRWLQDARGYEFTQRRVGPLFPESGAGLFEYRAMRRMER